MITLPIIFLNEKGPESRAGAGPGWLRFRFLLRPFKGRVIVLARSLTYLVEEDVALNRISDIRAYLRSNASVLCPFPGWQALFIASGRATSGGQSQNRTRLTIWFYDPTLVEGLVGQKAALIIPEDLLIARQTEGRTLYQVVEDDEKQYLLYANRGRLLRTQFIAGPGEDFQDSIRELAGVSPRLLTESERQQAVRGGLKALGYKELAGFVRLPVKGLTLNPATVRVWLMALAVLTGLWLAGSSGVIHYQKNQMQEAMNSLSGDLKTVLAANRTEQKLRARLEFLLPLVNQYPHVSNVFYALSALDLDNVTVNRIAFTDEQLQITGEASSASALLAEVSSMPWVKDARFSSPVARRNGVDRFTLVVHIRREALTDDAST